jgi:predicted cation transporter
MLSFMDLGFLTLGALAAIMGAVLFLPFSMKIVEEELEGFLLVMGLIAVTVSHGWSLQIVGKAVEEPAPITVVVLLAGLLFRLIRPRLRRAVSDLVWFFGLRPTLAGLVILLGLASGLVTSIVAALVLCEAAAALRLERTDHIRFVVCACYAIGLGSALTPLGGPLSAVVLSALRGPPFFADFFFLARLLGWWLLPGIILSAAWCALPARPVPKGKEAPAQEKAEARPHIIMRAGKIYIFVMALVFLGAGLAPLAQRYAAGASAGILYWLNSVSAVLDNATLAAAEIVPGLGERQLLFALVGLLLAGGMLVPGNIPNIVSAAELDIRSREWAAVAVPLGLLMMAGYFVLLLLL